MRRTRTTRSSRSFALAIALILLARLLNAPDAIALIFASPAFEPETELPEDFPYWEHVTQRRYSGPTVIYLGAGWVLTARHVGIGEIFLGDEIFMPNFRSPHTLMNIDGSAADIMVFQLAVDAELPKLPLLPLAAEPPRAGEEVLLIGFGRERLKVTEWNDDGRTHFGFEWTKSSRKRWGTNRILSNHEILLQKKWSTRALTFLFDSPDSKDTTSFEAHAAQGDSGGAVFVRREGKWLLAGMMNSVTSNSATPVGTSQYGDTTYAADISFYRSEIIRWARPRCANEEDDDGDGKIDFPLDPDCDSPADRDERDLRDLRELGSRALENFCLIGLAGLGLVAAAIFRLRRRA